MPDKSLKDAQGEERGRPHYAYVTLYLNKEMLERLEEVRRKTGENRSDILKRALSTELLFWDNPLLATLVRQQMEKLEFPGKAFGKGDAGDSSKDKIFEGRKKVLTMLALDKIRSEVGKEIKIKYSEGPVARASSERITILKKGGESLRYLLMKGPRRNLFFLRLSLAPIIEYAAQEGKDLKLTLRQRSLKDGSEREIPTGFDQYMEMVALARELGQEIHDLDIVIDKAEPEGELILRCDVVDKP